MARLRLFHESDSPRLARLDPRLPKIDAVPDGGDTITVRGTEAGHGDQQAAVWLSTAPDDATPYTSPRKEFRYVVEVEDADPKLVPYDWVPGWFRYLDAIPVLEFLVLHPERDAYVSIATLRREHGERASELDIAHAAYRAAVEAALDESNPTRRKLLHDFALTKKVALFTAAQAENESYMRLMEASLTAPA